MPTRPVSRCPTAAPPPASRACQLNDAIRTATAKATEAPVDSESDVRSPAIRAAKYTTVVGLMAVSPTNVAYARPTPVRESTRRARPGRVRPNRREHEPGSHDQQHRGGTPTQRRAIGSSTAATAVPAEPGQQRVPAVHRGDPRGGPEADPQRRAGAQCHQVRRHRPHRHRDAVAREQARDERRAQADATRLGMPSSIGSSATTAQPHYRLHCPDDRCPVRPRALAWRGLLGRGA